VSVNDRIILDKILEQQNAALAPEVTPSKFFEIFTAEQILKDYDLSYDEIESGIVGDGGNGGVDSLYLFLNGELVQDDTDVGMIRKSVVIDLVIIQAKTSAGFSEASIDRLKAFTEDLLDLSKDVTSLSSVYNSEVLAIITRFRSLYEELAAKFPTLRVIYCYASKGEQPSPNVARKRSGSDGVMARLETPRTAISRLKVLCGFCNLDLERTLSSQAKPAVQRRCVCAVHFRRCWLVPQFTAHDEVAAPSTCLPMLLLSANRGAYT
jgi:hypothetical protein